MKTEKELARSLGIQAKNFLKSLSLEENDNLRVAGILIDYPFSEVSHASWDDYVPDSTWKNYMAMKKLFDPEKIPANWINFIKEVHCERKKNGSGGPINLGGGLFFLLEESTCAQKAGFPKLGKFDDGTVDFQDYKHVEQMIEGILNHPELRKEYKHLLAYMIPDVSGGYLDKDRVQKVLEKTGIENGLFLDLGCGMGDETHGWSKKLGMFVIGMDRQYHCQWYDPYWKEKNGREGNLAFLRGDFKQGVPIKNECVDAALFQFVAQHVTRESLESGLKEALRVLKEGRWLFVGPQQTKDFSNWRFFKKELLEDGKGFGFKEYAYYDMVPEDKPKPKCFKRKS